MSARRRQDRDRFYGNGKTPRAWYCAGCRQVHSGRTEQMRGPDGVDYCQATFQVQLPSWQGAGPCQAPTR